MDAFVDNGARLDSFRLDCAKSAPPARLDRLAPGAERMYVFWADRARRTPTPPLREIGVRLAKVRLIGDDQQAAGDS